MLPIFSLIPPNSFGSLGGQSWGVSHRHSKRLLQLAAQMLVIPSIPIPIHDHVYYSKHGKLFWVKSRWVSRKCLLQEWWLCCACWTLLVILVISTVLIIDTTLMNSTHCLWNLWYCICSLHQSRLKLEKVHSIYKRAIDIQDSDPTLVWFLCASTNNSHSNLREILQQHIYFYIILVSSLLCT